MILQNRNSTLHKQMINKLNEYEKYSLFPTSPPSSPTFGSLSTNEQTNIQTYTSVILKMPQLQKFKTQACKFMANSHQVLDQQNSFVHHFTEYPYYYQCQYYHSERDQRRPPFNMSQKQQNISIQGQIKQEFQQKYSGLYFGDKYSEKVCWNWIQYLYHPALYKKSACNSIKCKRRYCPKIHKGQTVQETREIAKKQTSQSIKQPKIVQGIQKIKRIRQIGQKQYKQIMDQNSSTDTTLNKQISQSRERICSYVEKITRHQQQQINKISYVRNQIQNLAGGPTGIQDSVIISANVKNQDDYDRLFYQEQLKIVQDRQHQFKMFRDKDPHRISALVLEYISAFLNSDGGSIYLGINDQSIVHGLELDQKWLDKFKLAVDSDGRNHLTPPLIPQKYSLRIIPVNHPKKLDLKVIQIKVFTQPQCDKKVLTLFKKQCYLRMNASNHRLSASDIMQYMRLVNSNSTNNIISNMNNLNASSTNSNQSLISIKKQIQQIQKIQQKLDQLNQKQLKQLQQHINKINYKINNNLKKKEGQKSKDKDTQLIRSKEKLPKQKQKQKYKQKNRRINDSQSQDHF